MFPGRINIYISWLCIENLETCVLEVTRCLGVEQVYSGGV